MSGQVPTEWYENEQDQHRRLATKRDGLLSVFWSRDCFALFKRHCVPFVTEAAEAGVRKAWQAVT